MENENTPFAASRSVSRRVSVAAGAGARRVPVRRKSETASGCAVDVNASGAANGDLPRGDLTRGQPKEARFYGVGRML